MHRFSKRIGAFEENTFVADLFSDGNNNHSLRQILRMLNKSLKVSCDDTADSPAFLSISICVLSFFFCLRFLIFSSSLIRFIPSGGLVEYDYSEHYHAFFFAFFF